MTLRGSIATMPVEDVLEWAARRRVTGRVVFERDDVARTLWLGGGVAVWETSNVPEEQLGQILLRTGLVGERVLADALDAGAHGEVAFGKILVMAGAIAERDLTALLAIKVREAVCEVAAWTEGWFDFDPCAPPGGARVTCEVALPPCVALARARRGRWAAIRARVPHDGLGFEVRDRDAALLGATGRIDGPRLLAVIDEGGSAGDAIAALAGERFAVLDVLADLVEVGVLAIDPARGRADVARTAPEVVAAAIEARLGDGDRAGALALAARALGAAPDHPEIRRLHREAERARVAEVARLLLGRHQVPRLRRSPEELAALGLGEVEGQVGGQRQRREQLRGADRGRRGRGELAARAHRAAR